MLLVVEAVNGKDRAQLVRAGTLGHVRLLFCFVSTLFLCADVYFQVQHAMLVMKQLVLMHGIPSDVKVSSALDETVNRESQNDHMFETRQFSWKSKHDTDSSRGSRASIDSVSARGSQVSRINARFVSCAFRL